MTQGLHSLTPERSSAAATAECVTIPARLSNWKLHSTGSKIVAYRILSEGIPDDSPPLYITHILSFTNKWQLWVHGNLLALTPSFLTACVASPLVQLLEYIEECHICEGIAEPSLLAVVDMQTHSAFLDEVPTANTKGVMQMRTCREPRCELLISAQHIRCQPCTSLREKLRHKADRGKARVSAEATDVSKFTPNVCLSTNDKLAKLAELASEKETSKRKISALTSRIEALHTKYGVSVDVSCDTDLTTIITSESAALQQALPDGSFRKLFWQQQLKALSCKDQRQRRWHPLIIKWCLNLRMMSTAAYHNMRTSGMLVLPSERTLRDYSNVVKGGEGFSLAVLKQLFDEARKGQDHVAYHRRYVNACTAACCKCAACIYI